jgi:hypothetical protein
VDRSDDRLERSRAGALTTAARIMIRCPPKGQGGP